MHKLLHHFRNNYTIHLPANPSVQASEWYSYLRNDVLESNNRICKQKKNATSLFLVPNECAIGTHPKERLRFSFSQSLLNSQLNFCIPIKNDTDLRTFSLNCPRRNLLPLPCLQYGSMLLCHHNKQTWHTQSHAASHVHYNLQN